MEKKCFKNEIEFRLQIKFTILMEVMFTLSHIFQIRVQQ